MFSKYAVSCEYLIILLLIFFYSYVYSRIKTDYIIDFF